MTQPSVFWRNTIMLAAAVVFLGALSLPASAGDEQTIELKAIGGIEQTQASSSMVRRGRRQAGETG